MLKRILSIYANYKKQVIVVLTMTFLIQALVLGCAYVFGVFVDSMTKKVGLWQSIGYLCVAFGILCLQGLMEYWRKRYNQSKLYFPVRKFVRLEAIERYLGFSIGQLKNHHSGVSKEIIAVGEHALFELARMTVMMFLPNLIKAVVMVCVVLYWQPWVGSVFALGVIAYANRALRMEKKYSPIFNRVNELYQEAKRHKTEILTHAGMIIAHVREKSVLGDHARRVRVSDELSFVANTFVNIYDGLLAHFMAGVQYTALGVGALMVYKGKMTLGELTTIHLWGGMIASSVMMISEHSGTVLEHLASVKKFFALLDIDPAVKETANPTRLASVVGFVEFQKVHFSYPVVTYGGEAKADDQKGRGILSDVSFRINAGQKVAFVGATGAGKSTIISLLLRGYDPDQGYITIDGINLKNVSLGDYRKHIAVVDQTTPMLDATLRENVEFGSVGPLTDEELEHICRLAELDFANKFVHGLDTRIGQNGIMISGGEKQRVAIARALARNPRILILDEATSSLDTITEKKIKRAMDVVAEGRTMIVIAHRLSTVKDADRIFVLEDGRITSSGTHQELMAKSVKYQDLVEHQMVKV